MPQPDPGAKPTTRNTMRVRIAAFALLCVAAAIAGVVIVLQSRSDAQEARREFDALPTAPAEAFAAIQSGPHVVTIESSGFGFGRVALRPADPAGASALTGFDCLRVYYAAGSGLCLGSDGARGGAFSFDKNLNVTHEFDVAGLPSRVRVSPDGRYGAMTVFVAGHSYMEIGFSTRTLIVDLQSGETVVDNLEEFEVYKDGDRLESIDFNYWGVTFADDARTFYATLQTGGTQYLIRGDAQTKRADVLKSNVECPSLSPDGTRLAFKKRVSAGLLGQEWRLYTLDLATLEETPLAEDRNIDDQVEWLDNEHLLYQVPDDGTIRTDTWSVATTPGAEPRMYWQSTYSPAVVRGS